MSPLREHLYLRRAELIAVTDGDTFTANVDLGFSAWVRIRVRVIGYDTPERHGATKWMGDLAALALERLLRGADLLVESEKAQGEQSFDRWLAHVYVGPAGAEANVADVLVELGYARYYDGKKPRLPWDPTQPYPVPLVPAIPTTL